MSIVRTDDRHYHNIADAIREKLETQDAYSPAEMAEYIRQIQTEGGIYKYSHSSNSIKFLNRAYGELVAAENMPTENSTRLAVYSKSLLRQTIKSTSESDNALGKAKTSSREVSGVNAKLIRKNKDLYPESDYDIVNSVTGNLFRYNKDLYSKSSYRNTNSIIGKMLSKEKKLDGQAKYRNNLSIVKSKSNKNIVKNTFKVSERVVSSSLANSKSSILVKKDNYAAGYVKQVQKNTNKSKINISSKAYLKFYWYYPIFDDDTGILHVKHVNSASYSEGILRVT